MRLRILRETALASWVCVSLVGCGLIITPEPAGNYIGVEVHNVVISSMGVSDSVASWYIGASMVRSIGLPTTGDVFFATGDPRSGRDGRYYLANAVVPAVWQWSFLSGPCAFQPPDVAEFYNRFIYKFICTRTITGVIQAQETGYLPDGTEVYTGGTDKLLSNEWLDVGDARTSPNGRFRLQYQDDGNLVLLDNGHATWASHTDGSDPGRVVMQGDGNLVIYNAGGTAVWYSSTQGHPGATLVVDSVGCASVLTGTPSAPVVAWSTGSCDSWW